MAEDVLVVYVDGVYDVQNLGANVGITYFAFVRETDGGQLKRQPVIRIVQPKASLRPNNAILALAEAEPDPHHRLHS